MNTFVLALEMMGTVAFAASGAMTGLKRKMDIFGVVILGLTTAIGGGVMRDLLLGITPPKTFQDPVYASAAILTSVILFVPIVRKWLTRNNRYFEIGLFIMDTLGLGIFTVMGISVACDMPRGFNGFLLVFVGTITGVGGGIARDVLAGKTPEIFIERIYACASILGAVVCLAGWNTLGKEWAMLAGTAAVVLIRCLSAHFRLNLPRAKDIDI